MRHISSLYRKSLLFALALSLMLGVGVCRPAATASAEGPLAEHKDEIVDAIVQAREDLRSTLEELRAIRGEVQGPGGREGRGAGRDPDGDRGRADGSCADGGEHRGRNDSGGSCADGGEHRGRNDSGGSCGGGHGLRRRLPARDDPQHGSDPHGGAGV